MRFQVLHVSFWLCFSDGQEWLVEIFQLRAVYFNRNSVVSEAVASSWSSEWQFWLRSRSHQWSDLDPSVCQRQNRSSAARFRAKVNHNIYQYCCYCSNFWVFQIPLVKQTFQKWNLRTYVRYFAGLMPCLHLLHSIKALKGNIYRFSCTKFCGISISGTC